MVSSYLQGGPETTKNGIFEIAAQFSTFLVNSRSRSLYVIIIRFVKRQNVKRLPWRPAVHLSVVCLSVTLVLPTQTVEIFCNISTAFGTLAIH